MLLLAAMVAASMNAIAADNAPRFRFNVPPGPLSQVLRGITTQSASNLDAPSNVDAEVPSPGVVGEFTFAEAVAKALASTGWKVRTETDGRVTLVRDQQTPTQLPQVMVVATRRDRFRESFSSAATRADTPLQQTPATVDVVTQEVLESRNTFSLDDAMRNIPGAFIVPGEPNQVVIGASSTAGVTFTDGLRNAQFDDNTTTFAMQGVEVLRGPSSILTGTEVGGAMVNFIPKTANGVSKPELTLGVGSHLERTLGFDLSGRVGTIDNMYWRGLALTQKAKSDPRGGNDPHDELLSGMLGYRSSLTTADLGLSYSDQRMTLPPKYFIDAAGNVVPYGANYNPDTGLMSHSARLTYGIERDLSPAADGSLRLRAKGMFSKGERAGFLNDFTPLDPNPDGSNFSQVFTLGYKTRGTTSSHHADLYWRVKTGAAEHQLMVGADYSQDKRDSGSSYASLTLSETEMAPLHPLPSELTGHSRTVESGIVVQDQINWGPWHFLAAARNSKYKNAFESTAAGFSSDDNTHKLTKSLGAVYDINRDISAYASYTETFSPLFGYFTFEGKPLPPQLTKRKELGVKSSFFDSMLSVNLSAFRSSTDTAPTVDPEHPDFSIPGPGFTANGIELSASGSVTRTLHVVAGLVYEKGRFPDGTPVIGSPTQGANLWLVKSFTDGPAAKFDVGFGGNYRNGNFIYNFDTGESVFFPRKYYSFSTAVAYHFSADTKLNLTIDNLFDRVNYLPPNDPTAVVPDKRRTARLILTAKF
jgi:outer membrane receptor protein involved in Fe transport